MDKKKWLAMIKKSLQVVENTTNGLGMIELTNIVQNVKEWFK